MSAGGAELQPGESAEGAALHHPAPDCEERHRLAHWHILLAVLAATFIAYARTLSFEFVYDDFSQLVTNPAVHSWKYLPEYFTKNVWAEVYPGVQGNYYRPVFLLWCRINDALFGNQTGMWHLTTVFAHLVVTALVYFLVLRLVRDRLTAGMASLIFGLHPAHIEAVAWVSAVTEPLLGVFVLSSFLCYLRWREGGDRARAWLTLALFLYAMGMLEKETALVLPAIIGAYEWICGNHETAAAEEGLYRRARRSIQASMPFLLLTVPYLVVRVVVLRGFSHVRNPIPWLWMFYTWPALLWFWVKHLVVPVGLGSSYELVTVEHPGMMSFALPAAALAGVALLLGWWARRSRLVAFSTAWIILPLVPLLNFAIFPHDDFAHDRYLYLPSVGFAILVALALRKVGGAHQKQKAWPPAQVFIILAFGLVLGFGTWKQCFYFKDNWIFYRYNYLLSPSNPYAANNYGAILSRLGMQAEAIRVLEQANKVNPGYWSLSYNLGRNYYLDHRLELAERYFLIAIQIDPSKADAYYCLGLARLDSGRPQKAEVAFREALRLNPEGLEYHYQLALALKDEGKWEGALAEFQKDTVGSPTFVKSQREIRKIQAGIMAADHAGNSLHESLPHIRKP
jgi:tetratricopeptide (TPR) repeat protein